MDDARKKFHEFALKSILFKGRDDWYFCFLKAEKIAHVLAILVENAPRSGQEDIQTLSREAAEVPHSVAHFAAGEIDAEVVLAGIFSLMPAIRLAGTNGFIGKENTLILVDEYESLAQRFAGSLHLSPFASAEDFAIPDVRGEQPTPLLGSHLSVLTPNSESAVIKDINKDKFKGQNKGPAKLVSTEQQNRLNSILQFVQEKKQVSIKDISAVINNCSEKTIQRELAHLVQEGLIKKVGERRWSVYIPA